MIHKNRWSAYESANIINSCRYGTLTITRRIHPPTTKSAILLIFGKNIFSTKNASHNGWRNNLHGNVLPSQGAIPQLLSALWSLTSVFGMGTGISSMPSSPHYFLWENLVLSKLDNIHFSFQELAFFWLSPRPISNGPLHASPHFHFHPIYLIISQGS